MSDFDQDMLANMGDTRTRLGQSPWGSPQDIVSNAGFGPMGGMAAQALMNLYSPGMQYARQPQYGSPFQNVRAIAQQHASQAYGSMTVSAGASHYGRALAGSMGLGTRTMDMVGKASGYAGGLFGVQTPMGLSSAGQRHMGSWMQTPGNNYRPNEWETEAGVAGMSSYFNLGMESKGARKRYFERTNGLSMDDVAANLSISRMMGRGGVDVTAAEGRAELQKIGGGFNKQVGDLLGKSVNKEQQTEILKAAQGLQASEGLNARAALIKAVQDSDIDPAVISKVAQTLESGGPESLDRAFAAAEKYGMAALNDATGETMAASMRLGGANVEDLNKTKANLLQSGFMGSMGEFIDQVAGTFSESDSMDPQFLANLSRDIRSLGEATGKTFEELGNFYAVIRSMPGGASLTSNQLRDIAATSQMAFTEASHPTMSKGQRERESMRMARDAARFGGSQGAQLERAILISGSDEDRAALAAAKEGGQGQLSAFLRTAQFKGPLGDTINTLRYGTDQQKQVQLKLLENEATRITAKADALDVPGASEADKAEALKLRDQAAAIRDTAGASSDWALAEAKGNMSTKEKGTLAELQSKLGLSEEEALRYLGSLSEGESIENAYKTLGKGEMSEEMRDAVGDISRGAAGLLENERGETALGTAAHAARAKYAEQVKADNLKQVTELSKKIDARTEDGQQGIINQDSVSELLMAFGGVQGFEDQILTDADGKRIGSSPVTDALRDSFVDGALLKGANDAAVKYLGDNYADEFTTNGQIDRKKLETALAEDAKLEEGKQRFSPEESKKMQEMLDTDEKYQKTVKTIEDVAGGSEELKALNLDEAAIRAIIDKLKDQLDVSKQSADAIEGGGEGSRGLKLSGEVLLRADGDSVRIVVGEGTKAEEEPDGGEGNV